MGSPCYPHRLQTLRHVGICRQCFIILLCSLGQGLCDKCCVVSLKEEDEKESQNSKIVSNKKTCRVLLFFKPFPMT